MSLTDLDKAVESWFAEKWQCKLDFEIHDALQKLQELGLARNDDDHWEPATL